MNKSDTSQSNVSNLKILIIGDKFCGKTSIVNKFVKDNFDPSTKPTVACEFTLKILRINGI